MHKHSLLITLLFSVHYAIAIDNSYQHDWSPSASTSGQRRAPILLQLHHNLTEEFGSEGRHGICQLIYRVLTPRLNDSPDKECDLYFNSKQSRLCDIADFYQTLVASRQFNRSIIFPLADQLGRVKFKTSFLYIPQRQNDPGIMIDSTAISRHVLCVESVPCPERLPLASSTTPATSKDPDLSEGGKELNLRSIQSDLIGEASNQESSEVAILQTPSSSNDEEGNSGDKDAFWSTLLSTTEPKAWFLSTISLACLSFILLIALLASWIYLCRIRRVYLRRRCRGMCRFGCRCSHDVVRQANAEAAVCGPLDSMASPHVNGSIRSGLGGNGNGVGLYGGMGTMNSSRWGSNNGGFKLATTPLLTSMSQGQQDKVSLMSPGSATGNYMVHSPPDLVGTGLYAIRNAEHDLVDITPPSGFYDGTNGLCPELRPLNGSAVDSGLLNGSLASSAQSGRTGGGLNQNGDYVKNSANRYTTSPLYPMLSSNQWHDQLSPPTQPDLANGVRHSSSTIAAGSDACDDCVSTNLGNGRPIHLQSSSVYQPTSLGVDIQKVSSNGHCPTPGQIRPTRLYADTERML